MIEETRTVYWEDGQVCMIDQRILPATFQINRYQTVEEVADAIKTMVVRGAPAIGASASSGAAGRWVRGAGAAAPPAGGGAAASAVPAAAHIAPAAGQ